MKTQQTKDQSFAKRSMALNAGIAVLALLAAVGASYFATLQWPAQYHTEALKIATTVTLIVSTIAGTISHRMLLKNFELLQKVERIANVDELTGLINRRAFFQAANSRVVKNQVTLIMDVDWFKCINDAFGHAGGDAALRHLAGVLKEHAPGNSLLARFGGEEFVLLFEGTRVADARDKAETLRAAVEVEQCIYEGKAIPMTISVGLAMGDARDNIDTLLKRADAALYRAKHAGRNQTLLAA